MTFTYKGYDKAGKRIRGTLSATSLEAAKEQLKHRGFLIESIKQKTQLFVRPIPPALIAALGRNLSLYLKAGISLNQGLHLIADNYPKKSKQHLFLQEVARYIESGGSFSDALAAQSIYTVPSYFLHTIKVAQKSGNLEMVLLELSDYVQEQERIKRDVTKAFIYPSFILLIAIAMINFMLTTIIPKIVDMFESTKSELPTSTKITLALSHFFQTYSWLLLIVTVIAIAALALTWKRNEKFGYAMDRFVLKIPLFGEMIVFMELGRFGRVMALLLQSGVPFAQALNFAAQTIGNRYLRKLFAKIAEQIVEGKSFTQAVRENVKSQEIPNDFVNAVALGEKSSHLAFSLKSLSELYAQQNRDRIEVLLALLEPVLMLTIGGIIGFLVISMLLPIFSISLQ
ncbi:type II secretion system F family protein [Hydrogenimonas urashimensis]|uniref:type II secretion system F family protein n=1 Tax=Hydrogenimonas urashimensis TaxID=2740515 RepID=UPI00191595F5|nr:type II secretion system F family protein [Hydrogenimonas urashimensis]